MIIASVGKSGRADVLHQIARGRLRLFQQMYAGTQHLARMLCGGMSVAIPTAIPVLPFSNTMGTRAGSNEGSVSVASKFATKSTVP